MKLKYIQPPKPAEEKIVKGMNVHVHLQTSNDGALEGTAAFLNSETLVTITQRALSDLELDAFRESFAHVQQNEFTTLGVETVEDEKTEPAPTEPDIFKPLEAASEGVDK